MWIEMVHSENKKSSWKQKYRQWVLNNLRLEYSAQRNVQQLRKTDWIIKAFQPKEGE